MGDWQASKLVNHYEKLFLASLLVCSSKGGSSYIPIIFSPIFSILLEKGPVKIVTFP